MGEQTHTELTFTVVSNASAVLELLKGTGTSYALCLAIHISTYALSVVMVGLTFALLGGGVVETPPSVFSTLSKNGGAQRRRFWYTLLYIFSAHVVKISDPGHARSGHQVTSSDLTS